MNEKRAEAAQHQSIERHTTQNDMHEARAEIRAPRSAATAPWWELALEVPEWMGEDCAALLIETGALGVEIVDHDSLTVPGLDVPCPRPKSTQPDGAMLIVSYVGDADEAQVTAQAQHALAQLDLDLWPSSKSNEGMGRLMLRRRSDDDWSESWKKYFKPLRLSKRCWVVPSWEGDFVAPEGAYVLQLDPGMAFGTGQHATTALCAQLVEDYFSGILDDKAASIDGARVSNARDSRRMLDLGCGSGILALVAAKMGCRDIVALDNDPLAVQATALNCAQNGAASVVEASQATLAAMRHKRHFDLIVANILATTLIELAPEVVEALEPKGGTLVLSGILQSQVDEVTAAYVAASGCVTLALQTRRDEGEWTALVLRSHGIPGGNGCENI